MEKEIVIHRVAEYGIDTRLPRIEYFDNETGDHISVHFAEEKWEDLDYLFVTSRSCMYWVLENLSKFRVLSMGDILDWHAEVHSAKTYDKLFTIDDVYTCKGGYKIIFR